MNTKNPMAVPDPIKMTPKHVLKSNMPGNSVYIGHLCAVYAQKGYP